eukprot:SAG31_NODE_1633_length_7689_cov_3.155599_3_plen_78_part_00
MGGRSLIWSQVPRQPIWAPALPVSGVGDAIYTALLLHSQLHGADQQQLRQSAAYCARHAGVRGEVGGDGDIVALTER